LKLKIISYNLNGIRSAIGKDLIGWLKSENPDILLIQETKAKPEQLDLEPFSELGYKAYFHSAQKNGYSGVAIFSKLVPDHIEVGCGIDTYDSEGRVLRADFGDVSVMSVYFPSGSSGELRQEFKYRFLDDFYVYAQELLKTRKKLVISGDYNICHQPIDIHNPVSNKNSSGFLPAEREWISAFLKLGFVDSFRNFNKDPGHYTWWTYRFSARKKNLGWRIDYHMVSEALAAQMISADILSDIVHSDHCPVVLELKL
jgi:exodeoxyribonuclease-3